MPIKDNIPETVKVKSLYKALKLLDCFSTASPELGISELAEKSGLLKSSIYNILNTFEICGIVAKNPRTSQYHLGLKILELANVLNQEDVFSQVIRPYLEQLSQRTGETVFFAMPYGSKIIYREAAFPKQTVSARAIQGVIAPMYCTSLGKAILAELDSETFDEVVSEGLTKFTPYTITTADQLRSELEQIRGQGYAIDNMEHEYGIKCVGVVVKNKVSQVLGAVSLSGPSLRFSQEKIQSYAKLLHEIADDIAPRL